LEEKSLSYREAVVWNSLAADLKKVSNYTILKNLLIIHQEKDKGNYYLF
jgi:hypothetical protein